MGMWVATRSGQTACGSVAAGRLVADGDPMLDGAEPGLFARVHDGDQVTVNVVVPAMPDVMAEAVVSEATAIVEEAAAEPGRRRLTRRKAAE